MRCLPASRSALAAIALVVLLGLPMAASGQIGPPAFFRTFGAGVFGFPRDIAVAADGSIFVVDIGADRVHKFDKDANFLMTFGATGTGAGAFLNAASAHFSSKGELYVTDNTNNRVSVFDVNGNFLRMLGWGVQDGTATFQICTAGCQAGIGGNGLGQMWGPTSLEFNSAGELFVENNTLMQVFDVNDNPVRSFPLNDGGEVFTIHPTTGNIYDISKGASRGINVFDQAGNNLFNFTPGSTWSGIAVNPATGNIWVTDSFPDPGFINIYSPAGNFIQKLDDGGNFRTPRDIYFSPGGAGFVSDGGNGRPANLEFIHQFGEDNLAPCEYGAAPQMVEVGARAGVGAFQFNATPDGNCPWRARTETPWIKRISPRNGKASSRVEFRYATNDTGAARDGLITFGRLRVRVKQLAEGNPDEIEPPPSPDPLKITKPGKRRLKLTWQNVPSEEGYRIRCTNKTTGDTQVFTVGANTAMFTHDGLDAKTKYCYRVRAEGPGGNSEWVRRCARTR